MGHFLDVVVDSSEGPRLLDGLTRICGRIVPDHQPFVCLAPEAIVASLSEAALAAVRQGRPLRFSFDLPGQVVKIEVTPRPAEDVVTIEPPKAGLVHDVILSDFQWVGDRWSAQLAEVVAMLGDG